jgi:hypothetical protein
MPFKDWFQDLPDGFVLYIGRRTERGQPTSFCVVLIYEDECITRYDTAHGFAHRDILGRKSGLIEKVSCETLGNKQAFQNAIRDLKTNFRQYLAFYLAH